MAKVYKLYSSKKTFEEDREHLSRIFTKLENHRFPETPDMLKRGSRCGPDVISDERMLSKDWDRGKRKKGTNEYALAIPADKVAKFHGDKESIGGNQHTFDLTTTYAEIPKEWDPEPAPKIFTA